MAPCWPLGPGHFLFPRERAEGSEGRTHKAVFSLRSKEWEAHHVPQIGLSLWPSVVPGPQSGLPQTLPGCSPQSWTERDNLHSSLVYLGRVRLRDLFLVTFQVIVTHDQYKLGLTKLVRSSNVLGYSLSGLEETLIMKGFYPGFCFQVFYALLKIWEYLELPPK